MMKEYILHLRLKNWGIMTGKAPGRGRIQLPINLEQILMFWLTNKNLVDLKMTIYIKSDVTSIFVVFKNVQRSRLNLETQLKIDFLLPLTVAENPWK